MEKWFRVSFIARIRKGFSREGVERVLALKMAEKSLLSGGILRWVSIPMKGGEDLYLKFSTCVPMDNLDDDWNLKASKNFYNDGYGDLAWKITPVASDDPDGENTTCSIPTDLFQASCGQGDEDEEARLSIPPELFGSDPFWRWFEENEVRLQGGETGGEAVVALKDALGEAKTPGPLRTICAACHKVRDERGHWEHAALSRDGRSGEDFSHGICPECAKKLYPDLYSE